MFPPKFSKPINPRICTYLSFFRVAMECCLYKTTRYVQCSTWAVSIQYNFDIYTKLQSNCKIEYQSGPREVRLCKALMNYEVDNVRRYYNANE